jgi:dihydrofolate reductase
MHTFIIAAVSADGFIACHDSHLSTNWTSKEDLQFFSQRTKEAKACVMGYSTFATIGRPLPGRVIYVLTRDASKLAEFDPNLIRPTQLSPGELIQHAEQDGFTELAVCGGASVYTQFMQAGVVNTLYLTYEPILFGQGITLFAEGVEQELELQEYHALNKHTILHTYLVKL